MKKKLPKKLGKLTKQGAFRARDVTQAGVHRYRLKELVAEGLLRKTGRGTYMSAKTDVSEHHSLAQVALRCPGAVMCLLTALRFHGLTTENPEVVYVLLPRGRQRPRGTKPELDVTWSSGAGYSHGIEERTINGVTVKITGPAKTVADCFKHRNKVGINVAAEALRDAWRKKKTTADELWAAAKVCRMTNVMRPYLDMTAL